jgi:hypothetical protein
MKMNGKDMKDRRERERSRYRRGMASETGQEANKRAGELFASTSLHLPKDAKLFQIKSDKPLRLDILPYEVGKGNPFADAGTFHYERTFWVHRGIGPDNKSYACPRDNSRGKMPCPICEHMQTLREDAEANEELILALKPKRRQLFNVIDVNDTDAGVQVWDVSFHLFGTLLLECLEDEEFAEDRKNWCEFEGGKTLRLGLKEKTFNKQKFYEVSRIDFVDRKRDYDPTKMLEKVHCLDDIVKVLSYNELKKVFMQTGEETEGTKHKLKESDVEKIRDMDGKELAKFIIINDIDIDTDDFPETEDLQAAVIEKVEEAIAGDEPKSGKKSGKKDKDEEPEDTPAEIEEGSEVTWDDDGNEKTGTVKKIKGEKAVVEDEDGDEHKVALDDLTLAEGDEKEEPEIEVGSEVKWTDEDQDEHEGTVKKIKKGVATVKEGKKEYDVEVGDLELTD